MYKIYEYNKCSTCQKALRFLDEKKIRYQKIPIVEQPPSLGELKQMLSYLKASGGDLKNLFNTSGEQYRLLKISDQLKSGLSESQALKLLAGNGKLIKRPFLLGDSMGLVGFKPELWKKLGT
jgi:arsenate reductase